MLPRNFDPKSSLLFRKKHHSMAELCVGCGLTSRRDPHLRNGFDCNSLTLIAGAQRYVVSAGPSRSDTRSLAPCPLLIPVCAWSHARQSRVPALGRSVERRPASCRTLRRRDRRRFFGEPMFHRVTDASKIAWSGWSNICARKNWRCSTRNGSPRTCNNLAVSKFRETITCACYAEPWNCRANFESTLCLGR